MLFLLNSHQEEDKMINSVKSTRHSKIISILDECDELSVQDLARRLGRVSAVTVRRDLAELVTKGAIQRTHGAVARLGAAVPALEASSISIDDQIGDVDALILPPIEGGGADTLRSMARRRRIPFLAESSEQEGGVYVGPDNFAVGRELGNRAGRLLSEKIKSARMLLVSLERLPNTRSRCDGFVKGFGETFKGLIESWRVDGRGRFREALNFSLDAFSVHRDINVVFGVNDHSVLAALEASDRLGIRDVHGFSVGGEGGALFDVLQSGRKLRACAALFPEIVGLLSIDALAGALNGQALPKEIRTPHAVLTPENLGDYYEQRADQWTLRPEAEARLIDTPVAAKPAAPPRIIGFVPHYPAHDWYRNMIRAMRSRTDMLGYELRVAAPQAGIAREIRALRGLIARAAADKIVPGDIVAINGGEIGVMLAQELTQRRDITVVTNAFEIMERLDGVAGIKVIMTSGEFYSRYRCLVGPSLGALFETLKASKAFISVDGISAHFGPSAADERLALAARRFIEGSRQTFVLADHSIVGVDASNRIAPLRAVAEVITDGGTLPVDRLALAAAGSIVTIADFLEEVPGTASQDKQTRLRPSMATG
jgi:DeoR/GlpR family transcriptional regulator of sugar metabolism